MLEIKEVFAPDQTFVGSQCEGVSLVGSGFDKKEGSNAGRMSEARRTEWRRVVGAGF